MFENARLEPMARVAAEEIRHWAYEAEYAAYNFEGAPDDWLMDEANWGTEQFCLVDGGAVLGQVACQAEGDALWVGWSMNPKLCGQGHGSEFVCKCVSALRERTRHSGRILLRVAAWNQRAIRAYQKAGFAYVETIQDEIAHSNHLEDFWVMEG